MRSALTIGLGCLAMLTGCATNDPPLIFGKLDTFGVSATATAPEQGGGFVVGFRSAKLAVVPVTTRNAAGQIVVLKETRGGEANSGAFSTFAHFEAGASTTTACLGDTFATGLAAQIVADELERVCK